MTNGEKFKEVFGFGADGSGVIAVNAIWWDCQFQDSKPFTNADRIRSMTDEELAELLVSTDGDFPPNCEDVPARKLEAYWLDWLRQEAE